MDHLIRHLEPGDRPEVTRLLDGTVGAGFWGFDASGDVLALVAVEPLAGSVIGTALCRLEAVGAEDAVVAFGAGGGNLGQAAAHVSGAEPAEPPETGSVLHVRAVAVAPEARRTGVARRLLARAEEEAAGRGAAAAYLFAWLPAGQPEPAAVPFYLAAGYTPRPDIQDFYAAGSLATGAHCPYCGAPPCRCAARPYVKALCAG